MHRTASVVLWPALLHSLLNVGPVWSLEYAAILHRRSPPSSSSQPSPFSTSNRRSHDSNEDDTIEESSLWNDILQDKFVPGPVRDWNEWSHGASLFPFASEDHLLLQREIEIQSSIKSAPSTPVLAHHEQTPSMSSSSHSKCQDQDHFNGAGHRQHQSYFLPSSSTSQQTDAREPLPDYDAMQALEAAAKFRSTKRKKDSKKKEDNNKKWRPPGLHARPLKSESLGYGLTGIDWPQYPRADWEYRQARILFDEHKRQWEESNGAKRYIFRLVKGDRVRLGKAGEMLYNVFVKRFDHERRQARRRAKEGAESTTTTTTSSGDAAAAAEFRTRKNFDYSSRNSFELILRGVRRRLEAIRDGNKDGTYFTKQDLTDIVQLASVPNYHIAIQRVLELFMHQVSKIMAAWDNCLVARYGEVPTKPDITPETLRVAGAYLFRDWDADAREKEAASSLGKGSPDLVE